MQGKMGSPKNWRRDLCKLKRLLVLPDWRLLVLPDKPSST